MLKIFWQYLVPQHILSRVVGWLASSRLGWLKNLFINWFILHYQVDMTAAEECNPKKYESFNAFFTRALKKEARPIVQHSHAMACPVDGFICQLGEIKDNRLLQAKKHYFDLVSLLGGSKEDASLFTDGLFATLYLSPKDYHRVHMPLNAKLKSMTYVPGKLFSVNNHSIGGIPNLFARNERVICVFETQLGPMAVILVGAMIVGSIETVWAGVITPGNPRHIQTWDYVKSEIVLHKGQEMGRFQLGSTVIVLMPKDSIEWSRSLILNEPVVMGQLLGTTVTLK